MGDYERLYGFNKFAKDFENRLSDLCLFSVIWGFGGILDELQRKKMNNYILKAICYEDVRVSENLEIDLEGWEKRGLQVKLKGDKNIFSLKLNLETMEWNEWLPSSDIDMNAYKKFKFSELIIPTNDSERNRFFIQKIIEYNGHILLTGPTGTGKTIGVLNEV